VDSRQLTVSCTQCGVATTKKKYKIPNYKHQITNKISFADSPKGEFLRRLEFKAQLSNNQTI
ncbi:MAG: hypothetical protein V3U15_02625, partial [Nitrospinota bacterium]